LTGREGIFSPPSHEDMYERIFYSSLTLTFREIDGENFDPKIKDEEVKKCRV
jgi:hypothetical protein